MPIFEWKDYGGYGIENACCKNGWFFQVKYGGNHLRDDDESGLFDNLENALYYYNSLEPKKNYSKALWNIHRSGMSELLECHYALEKI